MDIASEPQKVVVQTMDDYYASPMFNLDVSTDFENTSVSCRSRVPSEGSSSAPVVNVGIEAHDLYSLLDQFEEASNGLDDFNVSPANEASTPADSAGKSQAPSSIDRTSDVIERIKSGTKRKSAIMLPLGAPAKRGRGRAQPLGFHLAVKTLQKVVSSNSVDENVDCAQDDKITEGQEVELVEVSEKYYDRIGDHDYCQNFPKQVDEDGETNATENSSEDEDNDVDEDSLTPRYSKFQKERGQSEFFKKYSDLKRRSYRKRQQEAAFDDDVQYYDRIPKYYSALSLPITPAKSGAAINMQTNDSLPDRDPSPERDNTQQVFNKLPAYHNCFTNSSKYDNSHINITSVQSSRSNTPLVIDSRAPSRSRSNSQSSLSCSSRSRSRSPCRSMSRSPSPVKRRSSKYSSRRSSRDRSRSHSRGRSHQRSRRRRSYSSSSSSSSRSRSRSRSPLLRRQRSSRDRSLSFERRYQDMERKREAEKRRQIEERRIVYIGKIPSNFTRKDLRSLFSRFGDIEESSVHFREAGDNYGFVTFVYTCDAYAAVEKGNTVPGCENYDLCFGGRRHFCVSDYADLDGDHEILEEFNPQVHKKTNEPNFDDLLQQAIRQAKRK